MPVYQYQGVHYELPDGLTNEQAVSKIKGHLGLEETTEQVQGLGDKLLGGVEAAASMIAPLPSTIYGGLKGTGAILTGQGVDEATRQLQEAQKSNFGFGEYTPATETGKRYAENLGSTLNKPVEWAGDIGETLGGNAGRYVGELTAGTAMNFIDPMLPVVAARGMYKGGAKTISTAREAIKKAPETTKVDSAIEELTQKPVEATPDLIPELKATEGPQGQMSLFDIPEEGRMPNPYEAVTGDWRVDENGIPIKADLSMEVQNLQQPLQRNLWGDELAQKHPQESTVPLTQAIDNIPDTPFKGDLREQALSRLEGEMKATGPLEAAILEAERLSPNVRSGDPSLTERGFNAAMRKQGGYINPEVFDPIFERIKELGDGLKLLAKGTGDNLVISIEKNGEKIGGAIYDRTNKYDKPSESDLYATMTGVNPKQRGKGLATEVYKFASELGNDVIPSKRLTPQGKQMWERFEQKGLAQGRRIPKSQLGGVKFDFSKKKETEAIGKIKALKDVLPELTMVAETPEQVIEVAKNSPDVPTRNLAEKTVAQFTKGFLYEKFKTDNPIVKYTYDTFSQAVDIATKKFDTAIRERLTPELRSLSNQEMGEIGEVLVTAMKMQKEITPEFLSKHGFSDKQIKVTQTLKEIHADNLTNINKARELAGKKPVTAYEAYIAGLATGNFKKIIYDNAGEVVGIVGSDFRHVMNNRVDALLKQHPEWKASEERYNGVRKNRQQSTKALQEALQILSDSNPNFAGFAKALDEAMTSEGYSALGAKKHTMGKKGIFGMEGDKPWQSSYENAKDMFNAQIRYTHTMTQWAEYSKAMDKVAKVFSDPEVQAKQPNALKMADDYVKSILGQNPTKVGGAIEDLVGAIGDQVGIGPSILKHTLKLGRNTVNSLFFTLNHAWMAVNVLQPFMVMPETRAFLKGRGVDVPVDPTGWSTVASRGSYSSLKHVAGWKETPFEKSMWQYAKEHGIDQTQLVEAPNSIRGGAGYAISQTMKLGANAVEAQPRSIMFSTFAHMLNEAGYGKDPELFSVARQLTDMSMTDYRHHEQIKAMQHLGPMAEMSANLTSFKQNTLSRYALFAREMGKGNAGAFTTALIAATAYAGIMGLPGFQELDWTTEQLSKMIGKPTTLSKLTLDLADKVNEKRKNLGDVFALGMAANVGLDLHNRIGQPSIMPSVTGGFGKLTDIGKAGLEVAQKPNEWNVKQLAREMAIPPLQPWMDSNWFTHVTPEGTNIALNKRGEGSVIRNEADVLFKKFGFTGSHESKTKAQDYGVQVQDKYYSDKQKNIITQLQEITAANRGVIPQATLIKLAKDYVSVQGTPENFAKQVQTATIDVNTSTRMRRLIEGQSNSLAGAYKLQRSYKE